jgi:signal transduction histidine kinase
MAVQGTPPEANLSGLEYKLNALNRLVEVSLVMNSTLKLQPLLQYIMESATEITGAEAASILLVDRNTGELRFAAATGSASKNLIGMIVPIEGSIAGAIIMENRALIIDDAYSDPRHFGQVDQKIDFHTRSIMGVPMRIKDKLVGVLEVLNKREGRFDEDDTRHITILASQAAVAIENAQLVAALHKAYEDLDRLNKLKNDFISIASHELRTPLAMILGYASFLKEDVQDQEASAHAEAVLSSALHMRNLIEGMTNLRYVQIDESELKLQPVMLNEILDAVYTDAIALAQAKGQTMLYERPPHPIEVKVDRGKTEMALTNIVNNAIKFTSAGGRIEISVQERPREAWVEVRDNGVGLRPDQLERIFEQFYQVEDPLTRHHGGMGLGLSIAKAVIERQGGRIWAESAGLGQGSVFTLALPLAHPRSTSSLTSLPIEGTGPLPE